VIIVAGLAGGSQVVAPTGTGTWVVGRTPGGSWSSLAVGVAVLGRADVVAGVEDGSATGRPSLLRTHPDATTAVTNVIATVVDRQSFISP
jgi:hypothetical protein